MITTEELGKLEFYFRKLPLHQQKFLLVSVLSKSKPSPWRNHNLIQTASNYQQSQVFLTFC